MTEPAARVGFVAVVVVGALGACAGVRRIEPAGPETVATRLASVDLVSVTPGRGAGVLLRNGWAWSHGVTTQVRWRARAAGTSIAWAYLVPPEAAPCSAGASLELLEIDGQIRWDRPAGLGEQHEISLSFPADEHLASGALVLDIAVAGPGGGECVRVPLGTGLFGRLPAGPASPGATEPELRAKAPLVGSSGDLSVEIRGLDELDLGDESALVVEGRLSAGKPVGIVGGSLALPRASPCSQRDAVADAMAVDGVTTWSRPIQTTGDRRLTLTFPRTLGRQERFEGPLAIDVATEREGVSGCVRVPIQGDDDAATWVPRSPWMLGGRLELGRFDDHDEYDGRPVAIGVRGGRWLGPVIGGLEGTLSLDRATAAVVVTAPVAWWLSVEGAYAGRWAFTDAGPLGPVVRHGPRLGLSFDTARTRRFDRIHVGGFGVDVTRWWPAGERAETTEVAFRIVGWVSPSVF